MKDTNAEDGGRSRAWCPRAAAGRLARHDPRAVRGRLGGATTRGLSFGLMVSLLPVTLGGIPSSSQAAACTPAAHVLPLAPGDNEGNVVAMNDRGWAIGYSRDFSGTENLFHTLLWRGPGAPVDLGFGGRSQVDGLLVDINNDGVVAVQRSRRSPSGVVRTLALLWHDGAVMRLPRGRLDNDVTISGLNDHGTAVGTLTPSRPGAPTRAVIWRDGQLVRLPVPRGARSTAGQINNFGLVTGGVLRPGQRGLPRPWFWRFGGGSGPIAVPDGSVGVGTLLDDRDRIVMTIQKGSVFRVTQVLFHDPRAEPRLLRGRSFFTQIDAMNDGDVLGYNEDDHLVTHRAWVARLHGTPHFLPPPEVVPPLPPGEVFVLWDPDYIWATTVSRGVTEFAPQGGVSVGGRVKALTEFGEDYTLPALWTCVATS